ncbi:M28 family peptidase [Bizionia paragorgiae]|uniref:Peptidase family M28 n=1 Tax=Bizionia paragorgiae TaxID=283786 RepID=A0A1H3VT50_BIZPA|nr:M28 family peptidase [Bizionia paragorgiae]SDZ77967.1 Peptidase family M28 [Bizionia paragorgiae]
MKTINFFLALSICVSVLSCQSQKQAPNTNVKQQYQPIETYTFTKEALLKHVKTLSSDAFEGRRTGTAGALKAKNYIIETFKELGVSPLVENYEQPFRFKSAVKTYDAVNVLGLVKGTDHSDKYIVITAHYDHEGIKNGMIYNGADDNASGVGALFAFAEYFKTNPPKHNVILAALDGEELGLKGAYYFVDSSVVALENMVLNLNFDMISRSESQQLYAVGTRYSEVLKETVSAFENRGQVNLVMGHDGLDGLDDWTNASDQAAFYNKNIPFIYFGVPDHKDYHKPTDVYENIDQEFLIDVVQTLITVFTQIDSKQL